MLMMNLAASSPHLRNRNLRTHRTRRSGSCRSLQPIAAGSCRRRVRENSDAGIVDEDIQSAEASDRRSDRALDLVVKSDIGLQRLDRTGPAPSITGRAAFKCASLLPVTATLTPSATSLQGDAETDAPRSARHDSDFSCQRFHMVNSNRLHPDASER